MRRAPAVGVACTGGLRWRAAQAGVVAAAAAAFGAWLLQHAQASPAWAALPAVTAAALAWWRSRPTPARLQWDGRGWTVDGHTGRPRLMIDAAGLLLLHWQPAAGRARWLAVGRAESGAAWPALRAALYSPAAARAPDLPTPE